MNNEKYFRLLKGYKKSLTKQQYQTLKGQIKSNNIDAFIKGLKTILMK